MAVNNTYIVGGRVMQAGKPAAPAAPANYGGGYIADLNQQLQNPNALTPPGGGTPAPGHGTNGASAPQKSAQDLYYEQLAAEARAKRNADIESMKVMFDSLGLTELWAGARSYLEQGYTDPSVISVMLSNNPSYQQAYYNRFPAVQKIRELNRTRAAEGKPPIPEPSPGTYIQLEQGYRQALKDLPPGLFGGKDDVAKWIVDETSPQEIADRVGLAKNYINYQANPWVKDALRQVYGLTDSDMVAHVLDGSRTLDYLQKESSRRMAQANVLGAANAQGLGLDQSQLDQIAGTGYGQSFDGANQGFMQVNDQREAWARLGNVYGTQTSTSELITETFGLGGGAEVTTKKNKLASQERAAFMGNSAIARGSLSARSIGQQ